MNKQAELQKLNKLKGLIENTHYNNLRHILIDNYIYFKGYLIDSNILDDFYKGECDELIELQSKMVNQDGVNAAFSFYENFDFLKELTIKINELHRKYPLNLSLGFNKYCKVSKNELINIINNFMKLLGDDVYKVFENIIKNEYITILKDKHFHFSGTCYDLAFYDSPRMIIKEYINDLFMAQSFAHEMGHYYEYIRNKTNKRRNSYNLLIEVPSLIFQKLFDFYLIENGYYKNDGMDNLLTWENNMIVLNKINDAINQAYLQNALSMDLSSIGKVEIDDEFLTNFDKKTLNYIKYYGTNMRNYGYVLSNVIVNNLLSKYISDKKEGLKEIKDFITTMEQYTTLENIERYALDMKSTEEEMKNLYNYQKKKFYL